MGEGRRNGRGDVVMGEGRRNGRGTPNGEGVKSAKPAIHVYIILRIAFTHIFHCHARKNVKNTIFPVFPPNYN